MSDKAKGAAAVRRQWEEIDRLNDGRRRRGEKHTRAVCALKAHPSFGRFVKELKGGKLVIDRARVRAEERLDGKYLLTTTDPSLSAEDVALGYKQLAEVERAFRTLKTTLELRPLYHRLPERIRAHVLLCWLALLLAVLLAFSAFSSGPAHALTGTHSDAVESQDSRHAMAAGHSDNAAPCDRNSHANTDGACCMVAPSCVLWAPAVEAGLAVPLSIPAVFNAEAARLTSVITGLELRPPRHFARA
jgi:hypothetical protein